MVCRSVDGKTLLLLDSGAQFHCGTTDVTRTVQFGEPKPHQHLTLTHLPGASHTLRLQTHVGLLTVPDVGLFTLIGLVMR